METKQNKFLKPLLIGSIVFLVVFIIAGALILLTRDNSEKSDTNNNSQNNNNSQQPDNTAKAYPTNVCPDEIIYGQGKPGWEYKNDAWVYGGGTPPACPSEILAMSPVDASKATSILYPGQTRGQYKPHGGFRFDNSPNGAITVKLPVKARLVSGAKYTESGNVQYLLDFVSDCGIAIRFDHLYTLDGEVKTAAAKLPLNPGGDTRGTSLDGKEFPAGTVVATVIGMPSTRNFGFDFGVYDYRQRNTASSNPAYVAKYQSYSASQAFYALCWLDLLPNGDAAIAKALPGGDAKAGKQSDYCK